MVDPFGNKKSMDYNTTEKKGLERLKGFMERGRGYAIEHGTKPSTIGLILSSNPLAFLAW